MDNATYRKSRGTDKPFAPSAEQRAANERAEERFRKELKGLVKKTSPWRRNLNPVLRREMEDIED